MAQASAKFSLLKIKDIWGAKSPEEERLIALLAELKGKLKLAPELTKESVTTRRMVRIKKVGGDNKKVKNKKNTSNNNNKQQKQEEA
jgi:hypothetical protein